MNASNRQLALYVVAAIATIFVAFFTAITITTFSPFLALAGGALVIGLLASKKYTFLPIVFIVLVICDVIPIPKGGRLYPVLIVASCILSIALSLAKRNGAPRVSSRAWYPVGIYSITMLWGYFYGVKYLNNNSVFALGEFQQTLAFLIFPSLLVCFDEKTAFNKLIRLTAAIGLLIGIASIFQYATGVSLGGRVEQLETLGNIDGNIIRATIPGKLFLLFCLFILIPIVIRRDGGILTISVQFICICILAFALLVSFGRALWASAAFGIFISALFLGLRHSVKLTTIVIFLSFTGLSLLAIVSPAVYDAVIDRALSVTLEGRSSSSFGWRLSENAFAAQSIVKNPLLGIGLGGEYKPPLVATELFPNQTSYIHNSYYFIPLKFGTIGLVSFAVFIASVFISIFTAYSKKNTEEERIFLGAAAGTLLGVLLLAVTQPEILSPAFIAYTSFLLAAAHFLKHTPRYGQHSADPSIKADARSKRHSIHRHLNHRGRD